VFYLKPLKVIIKNLDLYVLFGHSSQNCLYKIGSLTTSIFSPNCQVRVSAASTWASSSSSTNVTVNGEPLTASDDPVAPFFHVHRVSAAHSYRSLTPLNMDLSDGHVTSRPEDGRHAPSNETSLEMVKLSLTSTSETSEDRADQTEAAPTEATLNASSLSDRTVGPEVPSLPTDNLDESEPVSLSQIQLEDLNCAE
jgi:hypothetical protein